MVRQGLDWNSLSTKVSIQADFRVMGGDKVGLSVCKDFILIYFMKYQVLTIIWEKCRWTLLIPMQDPPRPLLLFLPVTDRVPTTSLIFP